MSPTRLRLILAALATVTALPLAAYAEEQISEPFYSEPNYEWFEPVDIDLDGQMGNYSEDGFYGNISRTYWAMNGVKTTIGEAGLTYQSEQIFRNLTHRDPLLPTPPNQPVDFLPNPLVDDPTTTVPTYTIQNDINDAPPGADFSAGERYELGYVEDDVIWSFTFLDQQEWQTNETYGFVPPDDFTDPDNPIVFESLNGFGSVHVNFRTPDRFLQGWRDYADIADLQDASGVLVPVPGLPGIFVEVIPWGTGPTNNGPSELSDGIIDDTNFNGGTFFVVDTNGDGIADATAIDYGDLHTFNLRFDFLQVRNVTNANSVEIMRSHRLGNRHHMQKHQNQHFEVGYGVRFFRLEDEFSFDGRSDLMGRIFSNTRVENQLVGPQVRLRWEHRQAKWRTSLDARFMFGWNIQDLDQTNGVGEDALPGGLNNSLIAQPHYSRYGRQDEDFSPLVELRAQVGYNLTSAVSLNAGYTATYIDSITRSSQVVDYYLPYIGIKQGGEQTIFMNGVDVGVEVRF